MTRPRTAYELNESQVATPTPVVSLFWQLVRRHRNNLTTVLDMGAGDCRFARGGTFTRYVGVEIDKERVDAARLPTNGRVIHDCAFRHEGAGYEACIGNPPYARHHDLERPWKEQTVARLERELGVSLDKHCNLYVYFFCLGLLKTRKDGMLALVIPYEWVSRPSAKGLRDYIQKKRWNVAVYRFQMPIFKDVMTTASISIVDKGKTKGVWTFYNITPEYKAVHRRGITDSSDGVLDYAKRGGIWALRGLSPGTQKVFTLTEGERVDAGVSNRDVVPCVTTLRNVPRELRMLTKPAFHKHYVDTGKKCWLIRSHEEERSAALNAYLESVPAKDRNTYTCRNQTPWFKYLAHPVPELLFSSGFTRFGPKVLINSIGAHAVGSVWGIHANKMLPRRRLQSRLLRINFANCAKSFVTRERVKSGGKGYVVPEVGLPWREWIKR